jgi:hypothetical protein
MCPHATIRVSSYYVSSCYYICVLMLLYMCPHTTIHVSSYYYICALIHLCVLILLYMCPHTPIYVSSFYYICPHTIYMLLYVSSYLSQLRCSSVAAVSSYYCICVLILLFMCPHTYHTSMCVLILLYMCPHTTICVSSYYYMCPHTTI